MRRELPDRSREEEAFIRRVQRKEARRMKARREQYRGIWFGLGMFGVVGWSVAIPTVIGLALGIWIDRRWPSGISWTLTLLLAGVVVGCLNAWYWVQKEREKIDREHKE